MMKISGGGALLPGFRFDPTDDELIKFFLWSEIEGRRLPGVEIPRRQVYGDNKCGKELAPWQLLADIPADHWHSRSGEGYKKTTYVFTELVKLERPKKRVLRTAGACGTWKGQSGNSDVRDSATGEVIGITRSFTFKPSGGKASSWGNWIMHEYACLDDRCTTVLCKISCVMHKMNGGVVENPSTANVHHGGEDAAGEAQNGILTYDYDDVAGEVMIGVEYEHVHKHQEFMREIDEVINLDISCYQLHALLA